MALLRAGRYEEAFAALADALAGRDSRGRLAAALRILQEDLGLIAAAWEHAEPGRRDHIRALLRAAGGRREDKPSLRFVLSWETDANDVDLHVYDGRGDHAYYRERGLPSGGDLYHDVTNGYGPGCFTIRRPAPERAYPYRLQAHYYRRGPMGYGMGSLHVVEHDGHGGLRFESHPFVVMRDGAFVDLAVLETPKS